MPRKLNIQHTGSSKRRQAIIQAALKCFVELGFANTTVEDIREKSGASTGSIYHHFKSKEMLAAAVYLEGLTDYQAGLLEMLKDNPDAREGVYKFVRYHLKWVTENPDWARYLNQTRHAEFMENTEESITDLNRPFFRGVFGWFKSQIETGALRKMPTDVFMPLIIGPSQEYTRLWFAGLMRRTPSEVADEMAEAAWLAVRGDKNPET